MTEFSSKAAPAPIVTPTPVDRATAPSASVAPRPKRAVPTTAAEDATFACTTSLAPLIVDEGPLLIRNASVAPLLLTRLQSANPDVQTRDLAWSDAVSRTRRGASSSPPGRAPRSEQEVHDIDGPAGVRSRWPCSHRRSVSYPSVLPRGEPPAETGARGRRGGTMRQTMIRRLAGLSVGALVISVAAQTAAVAAVPRQANGGSEVGVTPTQITLGTVITLTGPIPGLFKGSEAGTDAYFKYINSQGGVNKRKLVMKSADDALNCNQNQTQTEDLMGSVFAFVGSFSVFDNCGAKVFAQNPTVPDVHYLLSDDANKEANGFSPQPAPPGFRTGPYKYYKQKYPDAIKKVGSLYASTSPTTWANQKAAEESLGYKVVYERAVAPTETDWTADMVRMKNLGVQFWNLRNQNASFIAKMLSQAAQQNFKPQVIMTNSEYDASFFKLIADPTAANGVITDQPFAMFLGEDAKSVPEVKLFQTWMKKTN